MAQEESKLIAVMAIKETYVSRMLNGSKRVEFRRIAPKRAISHVVVYESQGCGQIVGYFEVAGMTNAKPQELWRLFAESAGIDRSEFFHYFDGTDKGTGILIGSYFQLDEPMEITSINPSYRPPQSFYYLQRGEFERIRRRKADSPSSKYVA